MGINNISGNYSAKVTNSKMIVPGQIIQGKILKIFPDNKAQIQLGTQKMIAQLEASLTLGEKYHFQVKAADEVIHLKVLGDRLKSKQQSNIINLMQQLGLKQSKSNMTFLQLLINEKVPFDVGQLNKAFQLLNGSKNVSVHQQILKEMIVRSLPLTNDVFQGLSIKNTQNFTHQARALLSQLNGSALQSQLTDSLGQMVNRPLSPMEHIRQQIISEVKNNNQQMFNTLRAVGLVDVTTDFTSWKSQWEPSVAAISKGVQTLDEVKMPYTFNETKLLHAFKELLANKQQLFTQSGNILKMLQGTTTVPLANDDLTKIKQQVSRQIIPLLSIEGKRQVMDFVQNNPKNLKQLSTLLQTLNTQQTYTDIEQLLSKINRDNVFFHQSPKDRFLTQVNQLLQTTGLDYENELMNNNFTKQPVQIKAMLLNLLQQNDGAFSDRAGQLLHFINGMQLQSVHTDNNHFIQANLLVPGEKLGLQNDLEMEFEGRKNKNGEINPDFCHVVFYLDLTNLGETVIDMNIQKRAVSVTVFNNLEQNRKKVDLLEPILEKGLENIGYHLSSVSFKPLQKTDNPSEILPEKKVQPAYKGVDFRI